MQSEGALNSAPTRGEWKKRNIAMDGELLVCGQTR
jgi:hypothetical protein